MRRRTGEVEAFTGPELLVTINLPSKTRNRPQ